MKKFAKRTLDVLIAVFSIIGLSPVLLVIATAIKLCDKGPALFRQQRIGKNGKTFTLYKFRTMKVEADPFGQSPTSGHDTRLISIGKFLREYSLDELPQLFNVLKGNMSIVGPRPLYVSHISELNDYHRQRLFLKPGITGLSQIYGRSELTSKENLDLEVEYIETQSFWLDIKIILLTFGVVIGKKGVYEK